MPERKSWYASPRWTYELLDCSLPMTFDQYSNCSYNCLYCFAQYQRNGAAKDDYLAKVVEPVNVEAVKRIWTDDGPDNAAVRSPSQFRAYVRSGRALQWGGMADPFCGFERKFGVGLELLKFFAGLPRPQHICFSTKGTWWTEDERYAELFRGRKEWNVKISIITLDKDKAAAMEKGVPSPEARLKALERIAGWNGGGATLRLRPFLLGVSNPSHIELIKRAADAGVTAVSTEFWCMERRSLNLREKLPEMNRICGCDLHKVYSRFSSRHGLMRLNRNFKRPYIEEMEQACKDRGLRFYVSDYDFKERCHNGSCCGLPESWPYQKGQFTTALLLCKRNGKVTWDEIAPGFEGWADFGATKAIACQLFGGTSEKRAQFIGLTLREAVKWCWNNPKSPTSPYQMFGGLMKPVALDAEGNVVYHYDASRE